MADLHLAAAVPARAVLAAPHQPRSAWTAAARDQMLMEPLVINAEGRVRVPDRPGFGLVLDEERIARYTVSTHTVGLDQAAPLPTSSTTRPDSTRTGTTFTA